MDPVRVPLNAILFTRSVSRYYNCLYIFISSFVVFLLTFCPWESFIPFNMFSQISKVIYSCLNLTYFYFLSTFVRMRKHHVSWSVRSFFSSLIVLRMSVFYNFIYTVYFSFVFHPRFLFLFFICCLRFPRLFVSLTFSSSIHYY